MPVDAVTLGAWLVFKSEARGPERADKQITPGSLKKYLSGIRWHHILNGHAWPFGEERDQPSLTRSVRPPPAPALPQLGAYPLV